LDLGTLDLCFVAALFLRSERSGLASFGEDVLTDVFQQVAAITDPGGDGQRKRASHSIRRLREQRLLARIDGAGVVRAGEYTLTRLATAIAEFFLQEEALTRESLVLLTRSLLSGLEEVLTTARTATDAEVWRHGVVGPLRVTISDLVAGIERRQRGFDVQQEEFQKEIARLLTADWFGALERCQSLLESTTATLQELNQILLRDTHELYGVLTDIQELAAERGFEEAEETARLVVEQVDRITAWGSARQRAWSDYYQYVHRYLRDVVRLDPSRTLTHRLREQLAGRGAGQFALAVARTQPMSVLRPVMPTGERPPVKRPKKERDTSLSETLADDPHEVIRQRVRGVLANGAATDLVGVAAALTDELPTGERFVAVGRVAQAVAEVAKPDARAERPWRSVHATLVMEDWRIASAAPPSPPAAQSDRAEPLPESVEGGADADAPESEVEEKV
jgi:chromosome partition protein MukF